jgi:hypothetical protein
MEFLKCIKKGAHIHYTVFLVHHLCQMYDLCLGFLGVLWALCVGFGGLYVFLESDLTFSSFWLMYFMWLSEHVDG